MNKGALERLQERIRTADRGWFFAAVADKVSERRQAVGLSQRELAELVGTTQSAIARLERGGRPPRIDTLLRIADALECDLVACGAKTGRHPRRRCSTMTSAISSSI